MKEYKTDNLNLYNMDCMELLKQTPDNYYDLSICDPPYGIDINSSGTHFKEKYNIKEWDKNTPTTEYFNELKRVSKNQIIWGGNYFLDRLGNCKCFIVWDKLIAEGMSFAMCEMAWTSFKNGAKIFKQSANQLNRIHPTQKSIDLYKWLLKNYAKPNDKILDTHLGSGSIAVACENGIIIDNETVKFNLTGCELDEEYFDNMCKRIEAETQQQSLF